MTTQPERWGGDNLGPDDMAIPEIKLVQNVGGTTAKAAGAKPGDFHRTLTDEIIPGTEGFDIVIVAMQKNRVYWGRSDIIDEPPECASMDAKSMRNMDGEDCSQCPHRNETPWLLTPQERREKCLVNYNVLALGLPDQAPVLLRLTGISAQAAKELYTQLSLNKQLKGAWYKAKTHVASVPKKSAAGDAFAIHFGKLQLAGEAVLIEELRLQSHQLLGTQIALPEGREPESTPEDEVRVPGLMLSKEETIPPTAVTPPAKTAQEPPVELEEKIDMDF